MEAFLLHIGINPIDVFAGFSGSIVAAALVSGPRPNVWQIVSTILVGTLATSYLGPVAPTWIGLKPSAGGSFGVGIGAVPICNGILAVAKRVRIGPNGETNA